MDIQHPVLFVSKIFFLFPFYGRILSFDVGRMRPFSSQVSIYQSWSRLTNSKSCQSFQLVYKSKPSLVRKEINKILNFSFIKNPKECKTFVMHLMKSIQRKQWIVDRKNENKTIFDPFKRLLTVYISRHGLIKVIN